MVETKVRIYIFFNIHVLWVTDECQWLFFSFAAECWWITTMLIIISISPSSHSKERQWRKSTFLTFVSYSYSVLKMSKRTWATRKGKQRTVIPKSSLQWLIQSRSQIENIIKLWGGLFKFISLSTNAQRHTRRWFAWFLFAWTFYVVLKQESFFF